MKKINLTALSRIDQEYPIAHVASLLETALTTASSDTIKSTLTITTTDNNKIHQDIDAKIEEDLIAKAIYEKVITDAEYRKSLISYIVSHGILVARGAHREKDLGKETVEKLFNAKINEVLTPYYIRLIALRFEKTRGIEEDKKHSR